MHEQDKVNPKVVAAGGGASVGVPLGEILVYLTERHSGDLPVHIEIAVVTVVASALAAIAGYLKSE